MRETNKARHFIRSMLIWDAVALVLILAVFLTVHWLIPSGRADALAQTVSDRLRQTWRGMQAETPTPGVVSPAPPTPSPPLTPSPALTPTPTPSPTPAPGDFSATFPDYDTGAGHDYSYQTDRYRIAVNEMMVGKSVLFVADVYVRDIHDLRTAFSRHGMDEYRSKYRDGIDLAQSVNAIFAASGDYCSDRTDGIIIRNGELVRNKPSKDLCVLAITGEMTTYKPFRGTAKELLEQEVWQTWCFGPPLLGEDGQAIEISHRLGYANPRSAIGYYEPGHYCLVVVDGRQERYSFGMTLTELSQLFADLGCKAAYNLDGGQTAVMIFRNKLVNHPTRGGRPLGDIIYFEEVPRIED